MKKTRFFSTHFQIDLQKSGYCGYSVIGVRMSLINKRLQITALEIASGYWKLKSGYLKKILLQATRVRVRETFTTTLVVSQSPCRSPTNKNNKGVRNEHY